MNKALHTEFQKAHRRHDLWICLAVPLAAAIWSASAMPRGADELANAYSALLYSLPVLNTVLMPLAMAALASRLWDVEVKGCTVKLLYTLQTRRSLFAAKAVFGAGEILLMVLLELAATALLGYIQHYTEAFPAAQLAYLGVCTYGVNLMLFFSELLLMLVFSNLMPALCVAIVGTLLGLFSAFMPRLVSYFVPWGYYVPLGCYEVAVWNEAEHTVLYGMTRYNWGLLGFTMLLAALLFAAAWQLIRNKEV